MRLRSPLRSLSVKLTLAFLLVGVIGAVMVAVLVETQARSEFDQYVSDRDQAALVEWLRTFYATTGTWTGVGDALAANQPLTRSSRDLTLLNADRTVVVSRHPFGGGPSIPGGIPGAEKPIQVNGRTVGFVLSPPIRVASNDPRLLDTEQAFLRRLTWAAAVSAGIAVVIALLLGGFLARTLTRPIRDLKAATEALAGGKLGHRVAVRSGDELGELAVSFNKMGSDLERATRARQQMTADLAHDLRTPISILRGYTEGLQDGRLDGGTMLYQVMHGEVVHLQHLVEDLRLLSLADAGALSLHRRAVDPRAILERTALAYFVQAEERGITLRVEAPKDLPSISVDTERMTQVLNNLVSNSLRHTTGGDVVLAASSAGVGVTLQVRDTGSGIPAADLPLVFDRFYRSDQSRQRSDDGSSGLGLAIAKAIVEAHGGTIEVRSQVGQGTAISITLPALPPTGDEGEARAVARKPT